MLTICWTVFLVLLFVRFLKMWKVLSFPARLSTTDRIELWKYLFSRCWEVGWQIIIPRGSPSLALCSALAGILNPASKKSTSPACICWRMGADRSTAWSLTFASCNSGLQMTMPVVVVNSATLNPQSCFSTECLANEACSPNGRCKLWVHLWFQRTWVLIIVVSSTIISALTGFRCKVEAK